LHEHMLEYVKKTIAENGRPSAPFRDRFAHTLRVQKWAERLQAMEGGDLEVIQVAALFHDVGWDEHRPHEEVGAEITRAYLTAQGLYMDKLDAIVEAVAHHNHRDSPGPFRKETLIIQDADFLDEVGVLTLVWDSLGTALKPNPSYTAVYARAQRSLAELKSRAGWLRTPSGRKLYDEQVQVVAQCLKWLQYELGL
jgi:uncharacterized protein